MGQLADTVRKNDEKYDKRFESIEKHLSQIATTVYELKKSDGNLPSQVIQNPKGGVNAVTLRTGRTVGTEQTAQAPAQPVAQVPDSAAQDAQPEPEAQSEAPTTNQQGKAPGMSHSANKNNCTNIPAPFPVQAPLARKEALDKELYELFSKVEINIPLIEAIRQIPRYAKFLKELCTNKRRKGECAQVMLNAQASAIVQQKVPPKCRDPGTFTIPCTLGRTTVSNCMIDLGASINLLPYSLYATLRLGPLKPAGLTIQLADRSCKQPAGMIEDVLVRVRELVFPADFYVLEMEGESRASSAQILLGRPFLMTARTKIDVWRGTLSMEADGKEIHFDIFKGMQHPHEDATVHAMDNIDDLVADAQGELVPKRMQTGWRMSIAPEPPPDAPEEGQGAIAYISSSSAFFLVTHNLSHADHPFDPLRRTQENATHAQARGHSGARVGEVAGTLSRK